MKNHTFYHVGGLVPLLAATFLAVGCAHDSPQVGLYPASDETVDVFTCKGLDEEGHWSEITDQFLPGEDPYVVVAAQLQPNHRRSWITYELTSPADFIVLTETKRYPEETDLGIHFDVERLMEYGGEGEWIAAVYADGVPLGKATFLLGVKKEEAWELARYHVIDEEEVVSEPLALPPETPETAEPLAAEEIESATEAPGPEQPAGDESESSQPTVAPESPGQ